MASIELRNVTVEGRHGTVLADVSLSVPNRSTLAVLAAPGSGATTLLRTIAGLQDHASGDIVIDGATVNIADPRRRNIALALGHEPRLHPQMDVFDNLGFAAALAPNHDRHGVAAASAAVAEALALDDLITEHPDSLTAAHRQRVAIGRELIREARAWLFDDVFSDQPERVRPHLRSIVARWQAERARTSVFTTGSVAEALALGDQLAVLHRGTLHQVGTPRDVYDYPVDVVVAALLGAPHMNLIAASVNGKGVQTPIGPMKLAKERARHLADRSAAVIGFRPEHAIVVGPGETVPNAVHFDAVVGEVEWRGSDQLIFIGFEPDAELEATMAYLEEQFDLDLFQDFLVVQTDPETEWQPGDAIKLAVPNADLRVFDSQTGFDVELSD